MSTLSSEFGGNIHDEGILHTFNLQFYFAFSFLVPLHTWYVCCADGLPCLLCHHTGLIEHHVTPIVEHQQALILWFLFSGIFYMFKTLPHPRFLVLVHYCSIWLHVRTQPLHHILMIAHAVFRLWHVFWHASQLFQLLHAPVMLLALHEI